MSTEVQLDQLRRQTRAAQHATSYPLLVVGVLLLNYGVVGFTSQPVAWRYAGALAFVALWALGKANEYATGVGRRGDYLAIAGGVFVATQLTFADWVVRYHWFSPARLQGIWVIIIGLGLVASGLSIRTRTLVAWGMATCATGIVLGIERYPAWAFQGFVPFAAGGTVQLTSQSRYVVLLGLVLTLAGFAVFVRERRLS
jgi:hypothetical protein